MARHPVLQARRELLRRYVGHPSGSSFPPSCEWSRVRHSRRASAAAGGHGLGLGHREPAPAIVLPLLAPGTGWRRLRLHPAAPVDLLLSSVRVAFALLVG